MAKLEFPEGFFWGAATSSHQVEGNNHNDWTEWEIKTGHERSGRACDHYNRFREDFDIAKSLNHNAHRFSIEWSRIEPEEGKWDEKEIEHYREVIKALRERGIEPLVTLWHWTLPIWVAKQGGWENKKTIEDLVKYALKIASSLQGIKYIMIFNEVEFWFAHAYLTKIFPPQGSIFLGITAYRNLVTAHKKVYRALKQINKDFQIGIVVSTGWIAPTPVRWLAHYFRNFLFAGLTKGYFDFFGLNYYRRTHIFGKKIGDSSEIGWEIYPDGLCYMIKDAYRRFKKPIIITENGLADSTDSKRAKFIHDHIVAVGRAMADGADVRGYLYWSLLDNFEWESGFGPRFGLVEINYKTMERKIRPSAFKYKEIIENSK